MSKNTNAISIGISRYLAKIKGFFLYNVIVLKKLVEFTRRSYFIPASRKFFSKNLRKLNLLDSYVCLLVYSKSKLLDFFHLIN